MKTKGNFPHNSKYTRFKRPILGALILFVVLVGAEPILKWCGGFLLSPLYSVRQYIETSSATIPSYIRERALLHDRIQSLEKEIETQKGTSVTLEYLERENNELKNLLNASSSSHIVAGVIARPPYSPYDTFVIDQGSDDGIVKNAPVFYGNNLALGFVESVFPKYALVTLFSDPYVETTVYVFGPNIFTKAYGDGGGVIRLSVPQGVSVQKGDLVALPSLERGPLGVIHSVVSNPTEPEQRAYVSYEMPLSSIRLVSVGMEPVVETTIEDALLSVDRARSELFSVPIPEDYNATSTSGTSTVHDTSTTTNP